MFNRLTLMALLGLSVGCATIMTGAGTLQNVDINSEPTGATVYVDGVVSGKTPMTAQMKRDKNHEVKLQLGGYPEKTIIVSTGYNGWFWGNFLLFGPVGVIVDLCDGSCAGCLVSRSIDETFVIDRAHFYMSTTVAPEDAMPKRDIYAPAAQ